MVLCRGAVVRFCYGHIKTPDKNFNANFFEMRLASLLLAGSAVADKCLVCDYVGFAADEATVSFFQDDSY